MHTFRWSGVPNIDSVRVQLWDRSQIGAGGNARFVTSAGFGGAATSYVIDLSQPGSPFAYDRPYTPEVQLTQYAFSGFLPPINLPPTVNSGRAGRSFPFKWTLADTQGNAVTDLDSVEAITYKPSACAPFTTDPTGARPAKASDDSRLRYDARGHRYDFDWKSPKEPGCYVLFLKLDSGQVFSANVMLSKARGDGKDRED